MHAGKLSVAPVLGARHRPSGLNSFFTDTNSTFAEYIEHSRSMIAQARVERDAERLNRIVEGNAPFELRPAVGYPAGRDKTYRRGILLVHGLSDSPYFMRHLATFFQENGFLVMAVLLPGHGTRPGDLLDVHWLEWAKAVDYGVGQLAREVDEVYLGGYSAGGALSVYQSMRDRRVRGLFLFAPALRISPKAAWAHVHKAYSWLLPAAKWLSIAPDTDLYKYESFAKNAAAQMHALTQAVKECLAGRCVQIPVFAVASQDDMTVDTIATVEFMTYAQHSASKLVYYFSRADKLPAGLAQDRIEHVYSVFPEQRIVGPAHTSIVLPMEDGYYGAQGEYRNGLHYYPVEMEKFIAVTQGEELVSQGEVTAENLGKGAMRRLMYNPSFASLKLSMRRFIDSLPT